MAASPSLGWALVWAALTLAFEGALAEVLGPQSSRVLVLQKGGKPSARSYARLLTPLPELSDFTACYRIYMYRFREESTLISYATESDKDNELRMDHRLSGYNVAFHGLWASSDVETPLQYWAHYCFAMQLQAGNWTIFKDGVRRGSGVFPPGQEVLKNGGVLIVGQEQDSLNGGFNEDQSFCGEFTEFNIWPKVLDDETIRQLATCEAYAEGDAISWTRLSWQTVGGVAWAARERTNICSFSTRRITFFPDRFTLPKAISFCQVVGGNITVPLSEAENKWLYDLTSQKGSFCSGGDADSYLWLGAHDAKKEGEWRYLDTGDPIPWVGPWKGEGPDGDEAENCLVMMYDNSASKWSDISCGETNSYCVACEYAERAIFYLKGKGICPTSPFNQQYILEGESGGKPALLGFFHSDITWNANTGAWVLASLKVEGAIARWAPAKKGEYPFGTKPWTLSTEACGLRSGDVVNLTLSVCGEGQFTCSDGSCISLSKRCDMLIDCGDQSDEEDCSLVQFPEDYNRAIPPAPPAPNKPLQIKFLIDIVAITAITAHDSSLVAKVQVRLQWFDRRLKYFNLKADRSLNRLSAESAKAIWTPKVYFKNAHGNVFSNQDEGASVECVRRGLSKRSSVRVSEEANVYPGHENPLEMSQLYTVSYTCDFDLNMFPFDTQTCSMNFSLVSGGAAYMRLQAGEAKYSGTNTLIEYEIGKVKQAAGVENHYSTMRVDVQFSRRSGHYVITHHLPIAFILILAYGTLFLKLPTFLDRIIVSLSSFLLAVSIFSQVCSGLPKTAYFKMVDIWLFVCLILIFAIVVCHATIEYVSEEGDLSSGRSSTASGRITRVQPDPTRPLSHKNGILAPTDPVPVETYPQERREEYQDPGVPKPVVWPPHVMALMAGRICIPVTFVIFNLAYWSSAMQDPET